MSDAQANIVSKLSLKAAGVQPKRGSIKEGEPQDLAVVIGACRKSDTVQTTFGDSDRFIGDFEMTNMATGEVFRSTKLFLPDIFGEAMVNQLNARDDGDDSAVEFAVIIGVKYQEKGGFGYEYTVRPLVATKQRDSLAHLREAALAALPAPEKKEEEKPTTGKGKK